MPTPAHLDALRDGLGFLPEAISGFSHKEIPTACQVRGLPIPAAEGTKHQRALASFTAVPDTELPRIASAVLALGLDNAAQRNAVQDALWALQDHPTIPERTRRAIAAAIGPGDVFGAFRRLLRLLDRLWVLDDDPFAALVDARRSLRWQIEQHMGRNDDWDATDLFDALGAFEASDRRFGLLSTKATHGKPKNLLFATTGKPDVRFTDTLDNDIENLSGLDVVLAYDGPIGDDGLRWRDLQDWWRQATSAS